MSGSYRVTIEGKEYSYPKGTTYGEIAQDMQERYDADILLVLRNGKLRELHKKLEGDSVLAMVTAKDRPGQQAYERSMILLFLKAFTDAVGQEKAGLLRVEHSVSTGLLIRCGGDFTLDEPLVDSVQRRMEELVRAALPIVKHHANTDEAIAYFAEHGMPDKAKTLSYRIGSHVNVYELDGFYDYFYGEMLPNTKYLKAFSLKLWTEEGLYLILPTPADPGVPGPFMPSEKVAKVMYDTSLHLERLGLSNVGDLNGFIAEGRGAELILSQEAMMEKRIGDIAEEIASRRDVRFVMIAGPSSSGKTTFSHRLGTQLLACGLTPHPIATDNYFVNRVDTPRDEKGDYDFESIRAMDVEGFNRDMLRLLAGETVDLPHYNFVKGEREYNGDYLRLGENDVLVIEGIHCLNDAFSHALPANRKFTVYISALTALNIDDHNRIPTTDARLLRRIERDARTRGYSASATIKMWPSVRRGEESHIFPYQDSADVIFNSNLVYETAVLRPYIEPLLFGIRPGDEAYTEARRLLKFLNYFLPIPADVVPLSSIIREFIGGGCYQV